MHAAKQIRLSRNARRSAAVRSSAQLVERVDPAEAELRLAPDRRDVLHRGERLGPFALVWHVGVQQGQVELDVHGLLEQLPGQVQPALGRVDVLVEVEHEVVGDDRVAGGEEGDQPGDQVPLGGRQLGQVGEVGVQVDLLDGPGVLDRVAEAVVEVRVAHRPQGQVHARVEQQVVPADAVRWWSLAGLAGLGVLQGAGDRGSAVSLPRGVAGRRWPRRRWPAGSGWPAGTAGSRWSSGRTSRRAGTSRRACRWSARPGTG